MSVFRLKTYIFSLKNDYFCYLFCVISHNTKHVFFRILNIYGNYCVLIVSKFLRSIHFDSVFNRIFDYVHGTHCLTANPSQSLSVVVFMGGSFLKLIKFKIQKQFYKDYSFWIYTWSGDHLIFLLQNRIILFKIK